jgi:hypothetical protein
LADISVEGGGNGGGKGPDAKKKVPMKKEMAIEMGCQLAIPFGPKYDSINGL